jgi:hypothetical protein
MRRLYVGHDVCVVQHFTGPFLRKHQSLEELQPDVVFLAINIEVMLETFKKLAFHSIRIV